MVKVRSCALVAGGRGEDFLFQQPRKGMLVVMLGIARRMARLLPIVEQGEAESSAPGNGETGQRVSMTMLSRRSMGVGGQPN